MPGQDPDKPAGEEFEKSLKQLEQEAPRLTDRGPVPYPAHDADLPLQKGMVLSIETTILHPRRGFIKLEDTVAVTESGCEGFGDRGRGWNRCGAGVATL
jgi:Xaa-Pro aminopeptidase